jgi:hypothetical protein
MIHIAVSCVPSRRLEKDQMRKLFLAAILVASTSGAGYAQVSDEEGRQACEPDVMRLCADSIPDRQRIAQCLRTNVQQISPNCRAVLNGGRPAARQ